MATLPKKKILRAIKKARLANDRQIKIIDRKWSQDKKAQHEMTQLWRAGAGHRFAGGMASLVGWIIKYWPQIKLVLGIAFLFVDEQEAPHEEKEPTGEYVAPPKPKRKRKAKPKDEVPAVVTTESVVAKETVETPLDNLKEINDAPVNPWTTASKVGDEE